MSPVSSADRGGVGVHRSLSAAALPAPGDKFLAPKDDADPSAQTPQSPTSGLPLDTGRECAHSFIPSITPYLFSSFTLEGPEIHISSFAHVHSCLSSTYCAPVPSQSPGEQGVRCPVLTGRRVGGSEQPPTADACLTHPERPGD